MIDWQAEYHQANKDAFRTANERDAALAEIAALRKQVNDLTADMAFLYSLDGSCKSVSEGFQLTRACRTRAESAEAALKEAIKHLSAVIAHPTNVPAHRAARDFLSRQGGQNAE